MKVNEKANTLIERFGFKDTDLTTPEHDKILLWLNENWFDVISSFGIITEPDITRECYSCPDYHNTPCDWDWKKGKCTIPISISEENLKRDFDCNSKEEAINKISKDYSFFKNLTKEKRDGLIRSQFKVTIEKPIMNNRYNIGFVDFAVSLENKKVHFSGRPNFSFIDFTKVQLILFEIKPIVKSIGEIIRQINLYRSHCVCTFILITKTTGLKDLLRQQDIFVYEYQDEQTQLK